MTRVDHQSGSDRIFEALSKVDPEGHAKIVINVQGDLPTIDPQTIRAALRPLEDPAVDIATLTVEIVDEHEKTNANVVKVVGSPLSDSRLRALYFTRATAPHGAGPLYHHIGLYAYRRAALERFVALSPSTLEKRESLEQLRALEAGMRIDVEVVADGAARRRHASRSRQGPADPFGLLQLRTSFPWPLPTRFPSRATSAPIPTWPAGTCSPTWSPCPARPLRMPSWRWRRVKWTWR